MHIESLSVILYNVRRGCVCIEGALGKVCGGRKHTHTLAFIASCERLKLESLQTNKNYNLRNDVYITDYMTL